MVSWEAKESWQRDLVHYPRPVLPLSYSFGVESYGPGSERCFALLSAPMARIRPRLLHGWVFARLEPLGGEPPPFLARFSFLAHLWRLIPPVRKRILAFEKLCASNWFVRNIPAWKNEWEPECRRRHAALKIDRRAAVDGELAANLDGWYDYMVWSWTPHLLCHFICSYVRGRFARVCREHLGLGDLEAYDLLRRSDPGLFIATDRLSAIARRARSDAAVAAALRQPADQAWQALRGTWFEAALNEFLAIQGDRVIDGFNPDAPTWAEMPELSVSTVKSLMESDYDPRAEEAAFQAWRQQRLAELRARLSGKALEEFDHWLKLGEQAYPLNDTHNYLVFEGPMGQIRYSALEAGRRLAAAGRLGDPEDVFYLFRDELVGSLRGGGDRRALVAQRRAAYAQYATLTPPTHIGPPQPPPPLFAFPPAMREVFAIMLQQAEQENAIPRPPAVKPGELWGSPGAPGRAVGTVRVVRGVAEFEKVQPGDVLVCPMTTPGWTVLFPHIAALVTDTGGALCHAAIIAREYGLPCVVGTLQGTRHLQDGQRVEVDGADGVVRRLEGV